jgi:hypothetical protein
LELLGRLNEGFNTDEWVIARSGESRDVTSSHFAAMIGDVPLNVLKVLNVKPYFNR